MTPRSGPIYEVYRAGQKLKDLRQTINTDIQGFVEKDQPSIRRIVFASGKTSASIFIRLNKKWLQDGNFAFGGGEFTSDVFAKFINDSENCQVNPIQLVVPVSVSPAAASVPFKTKREQWLSCVFNA